MNVIRLIILAFIATLVLLAFLLRSVGSAIAQAKSDTVEARLKPQTWLARKLRINNDQLVWLGFGLLLGFIWFLSARYKV